MNTSNESKQSDPLQKLFPQIRSIIEFMEIKDKVQAEAYETDETRGLAEMWLRAMTKEDSYITYYEYWDVSMIQEVQHNLGEAAAQRIMEDPYKVPWKFHENLLVKSRQRFLDSYEEKNDYYRMLNGQPPYGTKKEDFHYLSEPMRNQLHASAEPIHELSDLIQNSFMATDEYKQLLKDYPNDTYLKYLGRRKIDIFAARRAKDFEIIRYPDDSSAVNPNLLTRFASLYDDYREYVMSVLYNSQFESVIDNYRNFMGLVIMTYTMLQISNCAVESVSDRNFLDDSILYMILSMYDIPNTLIFTDQVRRDLAIRMVKLTQEKATDDVYYDLIKILGYQDIIISKLMLMKGQQFAEDGTVTDNSGNPITSLDDAQKASQFQPYFIQLELNDGNPYKTIASGNAPLHKYKDIIEGDPTWWDLRDTQEILKGRDYSTADSKYIMVEAHIQQMKYMFESIYFMRLILDNRDATDNILMEIPELLGSTKVSVYELMVYVLAATCMNNGLTGEIISKEAELLAVAGFNFDMDLDSFEEYLESCKYVDKERIRSFISDLVLEEEADIPRLYSDVMYPLREWLEKKIQRTENRFEYVEYESIYRAMFTYDINRNSFLDTFKKPLDVICEKHGVNTDEIQMYKHFYPHNLKSEAISVDEYEGSRYKTPFLSRDRKVDWYIHIVVETPYGPDDRGYLYFYDILNCADCRELTNPDGTRIFMDYNDGDVGWEINKAAVNKAMELLRRLDDQSMLKAFFQINTPIPNSGGISYAANTMLPASIRAGTWKNILMGKVQMDTAGLAIPPSTYLEYLYRKNINLYNLLAGGNRFTNNHDAWLDDVYTIVQALETRLNLHLKYFEQSAVGNAMFFKPLITLIKHFKSSLVDFARTGLKYVFGDKIDSGGNSNMFKLFDDVQFTIHFVTLALKGFSSQFGLYDAVHRMHHKIIMSDRSEILTMEEGEGFAAHKRTANMGSLRMVDEVKFFRNGQPLDPGSPTDPSHWISGEPGTGRWPEEDDFLMRTRTSTARVRSLPVDLDGWKDYLPSYTPRD